LTSIFCSSPQYIFSNFLPFFDHFLCKTGILNLILKSPKHFQFSSVVQSILFALLMREEPARRAGKAVEQDGVSRPVDDDAGDDRNG